MDFLMQNIDEFSDTQQLCELSPTLKKTVENTTATQEVIPENTDLEIPVTLDLKHASTASYSCALEGIGENTAILQFTHATNPAKYTALKQKEDLLTDSSLFPCLAKIAPAYYDLHKDLVSPYNHDALYCPEVYFLKKNGRLARMPQWKKAAVISSMAPEEADDSIIYERICIMMNIALMKHHTSVIINTITNANLHEIYQKVIEKYQDYFYSIDFIQ